MTDKEHYERLWRSGWKESRKQPGVSHRTRRRLVLSCLRRLHRPNVSLLDIGCGDGSLLAAIHKTGLEVQLLAGTDLSAEALKIARTNVPQAQLFQCDPGKASIPIRQRFDIVTCCEVLEHVPDYEAAVRHIFEVLHPGGRALITVPHSMKYWGPHDEAVHHIRRFEKKDLCETLQAEGFRIERAFTWGGVLYDLYYRFLLNRINPQRTFQSKSVLQRAVHCILYRLFFIDDRFVKVVSGRMLFIVAAKPSP